MPTDINKNNCEIKRVCKCPRDVRRICKRGKTTVARRFDKSNVNSIIATLTQEALESEKRRHERCNKTPKLVVKTYQPRHFKDLCIPMTPSMHTRLGYLGHCGPDMPPLMRDGQLYDDGSHVDNQNLERIRRVQYRDQLPCDIRMPPPNAQICHSDSDQDIIAVPSPVLSGPNIQVQRAVIQPFSDVNPPLPHKKAFNVYKAHSGILMNCEQTFVPDEVYLPGEKKSATRRKRRRLDLCHRKQCKKECCLKCKRIIMRLNRSKRRREQGDCERKSKGGVRDGRALLKGLKRRPQPTNDDDPCGLGEIPAPQHVRVPNNLKRGTFRTHSLTTVPCPNTVTKINFGYLTGTFNMYNDKFGKSKGKQALPMIVLAYCLAFQYHPKQWTMKLIDNLLDAGDKWWNQLMAKVHDHSAYQGICEVLQFGKKQTVALNGKNIKVMLCEPEIVGYAMSSDPTVYNLCRALKAFFKCNCAGVFMSRTLKVSIWRDNVCYHMFDPAGRDKRVYSDFVKGNAAIMNLENLDTVAQVILGRSIVGNQKFVLAPLKVLKMADVNAEEDFESDREFTQAEKTMMSYRILDANCAIVNANMHLGDRCFEDAKNRQALPIAIAALAYAKISPPNTWYTKTLDKIIRFGNKLFLECNNPKVMIDITIDNIPNEIALGPYDCEIIIYRDRVKGQLFTPKGCIFNIQTGLKEFFSHEYNSGILDFSNYRLAVWRQKDMFYLFDPYPRSSDGARTTSPGKACCLMLLDTDAIAEVFKSVWDYLPMTTQFSIHAFKVLKLKKSNAKDQIQCTLSDSELPGAQNVVRKELAMGQAGRGDGKDIVHVLPVDVTSNFNAPVEEEQMGDIISLVDSIQEDMTPQIPVKYKYMVDDPPEPRLVNLDSPTVSLTQIVPPWPKPRDKSNETPDADPEYEPTPPPTPPPPPPPEGGAEEAEEEAEGEQAEVVIEEPPVILPDEIPPPPPSPYSVEESPKATHHGTPEREALKTQGSEELLAMIEPAKFQRTILPTCDAQKRFLLRQKLKKMAEPIADQLEETPSEELNKPHNFNDLPDFTQIIRGNTCVPIEDSAEVLPFVAIMALVTSYKYSISTWTSAIVDFVMSTANKLYVKKKQRFQCAPYHVIPSITLGHQSYQVNIDVAMEGPTWDLENILERRFFKKYDRGMVTTSSYSCAFFTRNDLYYLFDGSACNAMGIRDEKAEQACCVIKPKTLGKACFVRFQNLRDLVSRITINKDGDKENQHCIISKLSVKRLLPEPRYRLPSDYDYDTQMSRSQKHSTFENQSKDRKSKISAVCPTKAKSKIQIGYKLLDGSYRIEGTTGLNDTKLSSGVKACHFVSLVAMLLATMHPLRTWDSFLVDTCVEKGQEIYEKATNRDVCDKRAVRNIILEDKYINLNIKKIEVINKNPVKSLEQYMRAVMSRLRYVMVRFPQCTLVVCQPEPGFYDIFNPYPYPKSVKRDTKSDAKGLSETFVKISDCRKKSKTSTSKKQDSSESDCECDDEPIQVKSKDKNKVRGASWTLYPCLGSLIYDIFQMIDEQSSYSPEFYTFELTSVKTAPKYAALNYRLGPHFVPPGSPEIPPQKSKPRLLINEKMYWLNQEYVPWSRMLPRNEMGLQRFTPQTKWRNWDVELSGDLYSLWGTIHPLDEMFNCSRGLQYLNVYVVALAMMTALDINAWTRNLLDGIVKTGDLYYRQCYDNKFKYELNYECELEDLDTTFDKMYPYSFTTKIEKVIFGYLYSTLPDRFNLSKALHLFFEKNNLGILVCPKINLAFGKVGCEYFMYDCQSSGPPVYSPDQGSSYLLKCATLNRLIYCMTMTMNVRSHGLRFYLYSVNIKLTEKK